MVRPSGDKMTAWRTRSPLLIRCSRSQLSSPGAAPRAGEIAVDLVGRGAAAAPALLDGRDHGAHLLGRAAIMVAAGPGRARGRGVLKLRRQVGLALPSR